MKTSKSKIKIMETELNRIAANFLKWDTSLQSLQNDLNEISSWILYSTRYASDDKNFAKESKASMQKEFDILDDQVSILIPYVDSLNDQYDFLKKEIEFELEASENGVFVFDEI